MTIKTGWFAADGTVKLAEKQGKRQTPKDVSEKNRQKEICLNCDKAKRRGTCKKVKGGG